uniref:Uncharacterized protein n=1 Tax=Myotis myotis TaxID=51298 RepID=A0A7J7ZXA5_MYOMY|nr:hypothetical protein mMyoMyo1_009603 [Myotis myotis]
MASLGVGWGGLGPSRALVGPRLLGSWSGSGNAMKCPQSWLCPWPGRLLQALAEGLGLILSEGNFPWVEDLQAQGGLCVSLGQIPQHSCCQALKGMRPRHPSPPRPLRGHFSIYVIFNPFRETFYPAVPSHPTIAVCLPAGSSIKGKGGLYSLKDY